MVKNGFLIYSDSLLRPAIEYYSPKGDSPELMKTLFYQGEIEMNRFDSLTNQPGLRTDGSPYGFLSKSTVCATRAYEMSREFDDDLWRAKSAEMLADAYSRSIQFKQSLEYTEEAAEYYRKSGKIRNHRFSFKCGTSAGCRFRIIEVLLPGSLWGICECQVVRRGFPDSGRAPCNAVSGGSDHV